MDIVKQDEYLHIKHLTVDDDVSEFSVNRGKGLESYLKNCALADELSGDSRTYLVMKRNSNTLIGYFSLRTGLIPVKRDNSDEFDTYSGIELANFAVNDTTRKEITDISKLGVYIFNSFIFPLVDDISKLVGAEYLYIYALPEEKLMEYYKTMGFELFPREAEEYIYHHTKPYYDKGCRFMYQVI